MLVFVLPNYVQGFWLIVAFIALPVLGWKYGKQLILDRRNRERNLRLDAEHARKQDKSAAPDPRKAPAGETYPPRMRVRSPRAFTSRRFCPPRRLPLCSRCAVRQQRRCVSR